MNFSYGPELHRQITERLDNFERRPLDCEGLRSAGVAVVIVGGGMRGGASVLLTRRQSHLNRHGGQFALPGGKLDEGETPVTAALRELHEELGLSLDADSIIGRLDDYPTRSGFRISPVVMWGGEKPDINPEPNEVAQVFHITLRELNSPRLRQTTETDAGEHPVLSVRLPTTGGSVFAPTAAVLYQFREVALRGEATRVSHYDQPEFAWK